MKQKVALVLSGGGARGMAHIGVIEELESRGYQIAAIAGTSMGALVGGVYALGKMDVYKEWLCTLDKMKVFSMVDFTLSGEGLLRGDRIFHIMRELMDDKNIEELDIPFAAISADILNRREVVFNKGSVMEAIRASIAIPTVFTPVRTEDGLLVDGGVVNNLPIDHVQRSPDDILVVVDVNAPIPVEEPEIHPEVREHRHSRYREKVKEFYDHLFHLHPGDHEHKFNYFDVINKTINMITYHSGERLLEKYSPDILVRVSHESCGTYDFYKAEEVIELGRCSAAKSLAAYKSKGKINVQE
ncbi:MAG: patatin-like phospholipase family protein [Bacteroidetes bacterium]|nr:patatin-like phospholipase family protein [Bacteroidota bacterium]